MRIGIFIFALTWGGATRRIITLAKAFIEQGHSVKFIVVEKGGCLDNQVYGIEVVELKRGLLKYILKNSSKKRKTDLSSRALANYLRKSEKESSLDILLSAANHAHLSSMSAKILSSTSIPVVLRLSNHLTASLQKQKSKKKRRRFVQICKNYPHADGFIAVSKNIAEDTAKALKIPRKKIKVVYNPTFTPELQTNARKPIAHPWINKKDDTPALILGAGRLVSQKNFDLLLRAFTLALKKKDLRLLILGEGKDRLQLEKLAAELGIKDKVDLPGFVANPFPYMAGADLFCLSSRFEGLPGVLIEAMATGCPVISTDSPGGAREILEPGRYGLLVPLEDEQALANAILKALDTKWDTEKLKKRASSFSVDQAVVGYLTLFEQLL